MPPKDLSDALTEIDVAVEWLGWAKPTPRDGWLTWELHDGPSLWVAIKNAVLATDGPDAVAHISEHTKAIAPEHKFYSLKDQLSPEAILILAKNLCAQLRGKAPAVFPTPAEPESAIAPPPTEFNEDDWDDIENL